MQDDSTLSRQKKDAESNWKAQVFTTFFFFFVEEIIRNLFDLIVGFYDYCIFFYRQMLVCFYDFIVIMMLWTESLGGSTSTYEEFADDGVHDVDGW